MNELNQIVQKLLDAKQVAIFTHLNPDGDALGSAFASKAVLEDVGIAAEVWLLEEIPEKFSYLDSGYRVWSENAATTADTSLCVDCGAEARLGKLASLYLSVPNKLCIDHHLSNDSFADIVYRKPEAAANAELIYEMAKKVIDVLPMAARVAIYTGLSTDTGHFKYSNVTENTFLVAAALMKEGLDARSITMRLYDTVKREKYLFMGEAAKRVEFYADGRVAVLRCPDSFLKEYGVKHEDVEELPNMACGFAGVLLSVLVKDNIESGLKYSLRGREVLDLSKLAERFGGGGHKNAAAFVSQSDCDEVIKELVRLAEEEFADV